MIDHFKNLKCYLDVTARSIIVFSIFLLMAFVILSLPWVILWVCYVFASDRAAGSIK